MLDTRRLAIRATEDDYTHIDRIAEMLRVQRIVRRPTMTDAIRFALAKVATEGGTQCSR